MTYLLRRVRNIYKQLRNASPKMLPNLDYSWQAQNIPDQQFQVSDPQIDEMYRGNPIREFQVAGDLLSLIPKGVKYGLLDIGCGLGYYSEVIRHLVPGLQLTYTGADFNRGMLERASKRYPGATFVFQDIRNLTFADKEFDIVFSSATIPHLKDYRVGLSELGRACRRYLCIHRLGVNHARKSVVEVQQHYGVQVYVQVVNRREFIEELGSKGFRLVAERALSKRTFFQRQNMSFLFERT
jgi:SAM-dependent methyltransferase